MNTGAGRSSAPGGTARTVIAIDDDAFVLEALTDELTDAGLVLVGTGWCAADAVALAAAHRPDVAIVDLSMPGGGDTAARGIRAVSVHTVVLVLTALDSPAARAALHDAGAHRYLVKGVDDVVGAVLRTVQPGAFA